jgi:hypothetical protein
LFFNRSVGASKQRAVENEPVLLFDYTILAGGGMGFQRFYGMPLVGSPKSM